MGEDVMVRLLPAIVADMGLSNREKAIECLQALHLLSADDHARADYRCAATTFATLALYDLMEMR